MLQSELILQWSTVVVASQMFRQILRGTWRRYFKSLWNICDLLMYALLTVAVVLRFTLKNDSHFEWARNVYAVDLILFNLSCTQFTQLYLIHSHLGPKVIMIYRMVIITLA